MGVDVRIVLPCDTRVRDVATAIAILAGLEATWHVHHEDNGNETGWVSIDKDLLSLNPTNIPEMASIVLNGKHKPVELVDGETSHSVNFHFEGGDNPLGIEGGRTMLPPKTPFWQAVGVKLVRFFGGAIDLDDSDGVDINMSCPRPRRTNSPEDGHEWDKFQQELFALKPLSKTDLKTDWKATFLESDIRDALDMIDA